MKGTFCAELDIIQKSVTKHMRYPPDIAEYPATQAMNLFIKELKLTQEKINSMSKILNLKTSIICSKSQSFKNEQINLSWTQSNSLAVVDLFNLYIY